MWRCRREFMKIYQPGVLFLCVYGAFALCPPVSIAVAATVTTYHNDNFRTGWNSSETILTPANVGSLELLAVVPLDEQVDAQPLYVSGVTIAGQKRNVVYVVTENDSVYALDAATGELLVRSNFGTPVPQSALP